MRNWSILSFLLLPLSGNALASFPSVVDTYSIFSVRNSRYSVSRIHVTQSAFVLSAAVILYTTGNFYGTPKPPAEPSPFQPDPVDQVLFDNEFDTESQRKRTTSVSKMERMDSSLPEEEEDEDKDAVNGSGSTGL